jgi:hypothetical protein
MGYRGNTGSDATTDFSIYLGPESEFNSGFDKAPSVDALNRKLENLLADADAGLPKTLDYDQPEFGPREGEWRPEIYSDEVPVESNEERERDYLLGKNLGLNDSDYEGPDFEDDDEDDDGGMGVAA